MLENNNISDRCNNTDNVIVFDKLKGIKKKENNFGLYSFYLSDNREIVTHNYSQIVDPSYDQVFKKIFEEGNVFNKIEGKQRLISFLNSIIFPDTENDPRIYEIERLSNESTNMNIGNSLGSLRYDILCKAKCKSKYNQKNEKTINIEMQLSCDSHLRKRLINYASTVYKLYNLETIVLCLVNKKSDKDDFTTSFTRLITSHQRKKTVENLNDLKIIVLNLPELIEQINNEVEIIVENKKIETIGRNWIKLLGIRNWGLKEFHRFILPSEINFECDELKSTFLMLKNTKELDLARAISEQQFIDGVLEETKQEGEKEGKIEGKMEGTIEGKKKREIEIMINFFNKNEKLLEDNMDSISEKEMKYSELEIKQNSKDRITNIDRFIELLKKKRKIKTSD